MSDRGNTVYINKKVIYHRVSFRIFHEGGAPLFFRKTGTTVFYVMFLWKLVCDLENIVDM